jgi:hypothetical protein
MPTVLSVPLDRLQKIQRFANSLKNVQHALRMNTRIQSGKVNANHARILTQRSSLKVANRGTTTEKRTANHQILGSVTPFSAPFLQMEVATMLVKIVQLDNMVISMVYIVFFAPLVFTKTPSPNPNVRSVHQTVVK